MSTQKMPDGHPPEVESFRLPSGQKIKFKTFLVSAGLEGASQEGG